MRSARRLPLLLYLPLLAGCVAGRNIEAPSLSPRAVEKDVVSLPDAASEPQVAVDPALVQKIATIEAAAAAGHSAFETARARTEPAVARAAGAAIGSEPWTAAQQELSALDALRIEVGHAATDIDALRDDPATATSGNRAAIEAAEARVEALSKAESDAVARLSRGLKS